MVLHRTKHHFIMNLYCSQPDINVMVCSGLQIQDSMKGGII